MELSKQERRDMICLFVNAANLLVDEYPRRDERYGRAIDGCCVALDYAEMELNDLTWDWEDLYSVDHWHQIQTKCMTLLRVFNPGTFIYWWEGGELEPRLFALLSCAAMLMNEMESI